MSQISLILISENNSSMVMLRVNSLPKITEEKQYQILTQLNQLNSTYRYGTFYLDSDNNINFQYSLPSTLPISCVGNSAMEMVLRIIKIIDDAYPVIMKTLWS